MGDPQPTLRLSKKAVDLTSSGSTVVDLPLQGDKGGKGGGKGGKGQQAHPQPKGTGTTSDAAGVVQTREDRGRNNKELCTNFFYGSCRKGDACTRLHVSLAVINAEAAKREKQRIETKANEGDGATTPLTPAEHTGKEKVCFQFRNNGTCEYGDRCAFEHVTPGQPKAKACRVRKKNLSTDPIPGALVMVPNDSRHVPLRGALGQIVGEGIDGRYRVQLDVGVTDDVLTNQLVELAFDLGMFLGQDCTVIPKDNRLMVLKAKRAYKDSGISPNTAFSANAIFDSGSQVFLTGCRGIIHNYRKLDEPMVTEGVLDTEAQYTHGGDVYFVMPGGTRKATAYYHPQETMTIVPAEMWDDTMYYFTCKDRTLHLFKKGDEDDVALGSYPRDVVVESGKQYNSKFLQCLASQAIKGKKRHILYPMPDSFFLWNDDAKEAHGKARVSTVAVPTTVVKDLPTPMPPPSVEVEVADPEVKVVDPVEGGACEDISMLEREDEDALDGVAPSLSEDHQECLNGLTELRSDRAYDAIQDFLATPDARLSQDEKKAAAVDKAQTLYDELHHVLGHRSREHTVRQIEWMYGKRMPPVIENMLEHCKACDLSKLTSAPYMKEPLLVPSRPGEILSADTIVDLPLSLSGYRYVIHISCVYSNYGAVWMTKDKSATKHALYWLKHTRNLTGLGVAVFMVDLGEFFSNDMAAFCMQKGVAFRVGVADTTNNMPIERRHRTLKELQRSLMNQGGAGDHMWEFAIPHANHILNLTIRIAKLQGAGRPGKGRLRPLTPFEQFVNHEKRIDIQAMWRSLHHLFSLGVGYLENHRTTATGLC